ncbi:FAD-dependent oxidoreductase [Paenibacillus humicola]|uniref:FAD-dependent oxidoreductase n=1 Tax=Paenibacillus humicola TaxID=3110540 RepID=UPI00237AFA19|nr:FAD-dependent oxidoreductase [Paenibacillus humicola]
MKEELDEMDQKANQEQVPVLIAGGGLVGLSAALFLSRYRVPYLLVERHPGTSIHPRARGFNIRTMELYRWLGLEEAIREAGRDLNKSMGIYTAETFASAELDLLKNGLPEQLKQAAAGMFKQAGALSPVAGNRCTQDVVEPVLLGEARRQGGDLRFNTELESFEQDEAGVTAVILDRASGERSTVRSRYMIAADGAKSGIRESLGISMEGRGAHGNHINIYFQADLRQWVEGREFSIMNITHPDAPGMLVSINNADRWCYHVSYFPEAGQIPGEYTPERCRRIVETALGIPGLDVVVLSALPWESAERTAKSLQAGRIFLAGDAAHVMPPSGGYGANTGVQDAHNLTWKLATVLNGTAGPALLATYHEERHRVAAATVLQAGRMADSGMLRIMNVIPDKSAPAPADMLAVMLGYRYTSAAVIGGSAGEPTIPAELEPKAEPGTRAPHVWLLQDESRLSTLDLFGGRFVLLAGPDGTAWREAAREAGRLLGVDVAAFLIGDGGELAEETDGDFARSYRLGAGEAALIRPDGFIGWRGAAADGTARGLADALARLLCRA